MFELCWQAAVVGFLHVHHLSVGAKDVELSWTGEKQADDSVMQQLLQVQARARLHFTTFFCNFYQIAEISMTNIYQPIAKNNHLT